MTGRPDPNRPPRAVVRAAVRAALADLDPGDRVLVALSGGADSLALLGATVVVGRDMGLLVASVIVDHGLQSDSAEVAARAAEQARLLGCADVTVMRVDVERGPGSGGLEAAARRARYDALMRCAGLRDGAPAGDRPLRGGVPAGRGGAAAAVLLGHTRDDQAETVLLGLARGSGTRSLAGMTPRSGVFRRPLLDLPRSVVARAAADAAAEDPRLVPWADPHNEDPSYARVRVRHEALPALERALGPGITEALARTARLARDDADALDAWAAQVWARVAPPEVATGPAPASPTPAKAAPGEAARTEPAPASPTPAEPTHHDPGRPMLLEAHPVSGIMAEGEVVASGREGEAAPSGRDGEGEVAPSGREGEVAPSGRDGEGEVVASGTPEGAVLDLGLLADPQGGPVPAAVVSRVVRRLLLAAGCPAGSLGAEHVLAVVALVGPATRGEVALPGGLRARREGASVVVRA